MRRALCLIAIALAACVGVNSQTRDDLKSEGLRGPVRSVRSQSRDSFTIDGKTSEDRPKQMDTLNFDRAGHLVERTIYDDYGFLAGTEKYGLDAEGKLVSSDFTNEKGKAQEKTVYEYERGNLRELRNYDGKGQLTLKQTYTYDAQGRLQEESYYAGGKLVGKTTFQVDAKGRMLGAAFFRGDGTRSTAPLGPCYRAHRVVYKYNDAGQVIESTSYETNDEVKRTSSYRYNDRGKVIAELRKDSYSTLDFRHEYEYDAQGSWIKDTIRQHTTRVPLFNEKADESDRVIIQTRQITYY